MKKYFCDRCGNEVKYAEPFVVIYGLIDKDTKTTEAKDLCGTCYNELVDFIEGDKDNEQD